MKTILFISIASFVGAVLILCCPGLAHGAETWMALPQASALPQTSGAQASELSVQASDFEKAVLEVNLSGLFYDLIENSDHRNFVAISLKNEDYGYTRDVGSPRLPVIRELIEVPYGASCSVELVNPVYQEYRLSELGWNAPLYPAQAPLPKKPGALENQIFALNQEVYASNAYCLNQTVSFEDAGFIRGYRVGFLQVFPVNYNPVAGTLKVLTRATVKVRFDNADPEATQAARARLADSAFDQLATRIIKNKAVFQNSCALTNPKGSRSTGLLVIAHTTFVTSPSLQDFADLKNSLGFETTVVSHTTAGGTKTAIQAYIKNAVENWALPPTYVILVGDTSHISHWTGSGTYNPATDLNYACVRGNDYFPDVFIGRFSVSATSQLTNLVNKISAMETVGTKKAVFMASEDNYSISEGTHNYVINTHLNAAGWTSDKLYCHTYNATTSQVTQAFNNGRTFAAYSGHGWDGGWGDGPAFDQNNVRALTNTIYPIVLSFACSTGAYTTSECFTETWIRDDHGATIAYGASESSYWDEDDILERRMVDAWHDHGLERFGEMEDYGMYKVYQFSGGGSFARMYYEMYNTMGDPTQKVLAEELGGV
ncbi:MAG: C25 family cysteine peptidase, partial [Planctomycetota bacterium]